MKDEYENFLLNDDEAKIRDDYVAAKAAWKVLKQTIKDNCPGKKHKLVARGDSGLKYCDSCGRDKLGYIVKMEYTNGLGYANGWVFPSFTEGLSRSALWCENCCEFRATIRDITYRAGVLYPNGVSNEISYYCSKCSTKLMTRKEA